MPNENQMPYPSSLVFSTVIFTSIVTVYALRDASSRYLEPIYGNVFPYHHLNEATALSFILAVTIASGTFLSYQMVYKTLNIASLLLALSPLTMDTLSTFSSRWGPLWGPHLTQLFVLYGTTFLLGISCSISGKRWFLSQKKSFSFIIQMISLLLAYLTCTALPAHVFSLPSCQTIFLNSSLLGISAALLLLIIQRRNSNRAEVVKIFRNLIPQAIIAMVLTYIFTTSPHCGYNMELRQVVPHTQWTILDKAESITGWVEVVEENGSMNMRVMRSGHSLLGGRYRDGGESIFQTFHLLEGTER